MRYWISALALGASLGTVHAATLDPSEAKALAQEAYVFAYATAEHDKVLTAIAAKLPFNRLYSEPRLLGPQDNKVVSPNNDTFYSRALLDLRSEPMVLEVPAVQGRYYSFQLVDMRTDNLDYIGTRATGNQTGRYLIAGPDWQGALPDGFDGVIRSPSRLVFLLGRTEVKGEADQQDAAKVLMGYALQPLSKVSAGAAPAALAPLQLPLYQDTKQGPAQALFGSFNALAPLHQWTPTERSKLQRFAAIGVKPGQAFEPPADLSDAIAQGAEAGRDQVRAASSQVSVEQRGWFRSPTNVGKFGDDDLTRAAVAWRYIYANDPVEAVYPMALHDAQGQPLDGSKTYRLHFPAGQLPPVNAFWSLTLYDGKTQLLAANPIQRYALGDRSPDLHYDADGGLTLMLQPDAPAQAPQSNWLPTPAGPFNLLLRLYLPKAGALDGSYQLPTIARIEP
ncbi:hypothetical protein AEQ67_05565 [Pseudomonas sp. RIT-PI-q]|uniref:DUF1254 domain-containing protein n=1 Tax=Pseudomonas sp. RIT-PI-q TaxID=1690247 RepID=UPI0006CCFB8E|nr:DUF1254 domain-containing protein [Pseudomonas sp. RIT-PI-q]KPH01726.1 hypothetical protein AEQ67_05565 [Pseudomonas sp. RIT-PI-q]